MYFTIVMLQNTVFLSNNISFPKNTIFSANFRYFMYFCSGK